MAFLKVDKACTSILSKYADFIDVFPKDLAAKQSEYTRINDYAIDLSEEYQSYSIDLYIT